MKLYRTGQPLMKAQPKKTLGNPAVLQENLLKVWKKRSAEEGLNQKEAADLLGWTRGALCQYLNGHTKIGPEVLIKLANFCDVDPRELDPAIEQFLPSIRKLPIIHESNNADVIKDQSITSVASTDMKEMGACVIRVTHPMSWETEGKWNTVASGYLVCLKKPNRALVKDSSLWACLLYTSPSPRD